MRLDQYPASLRMADTTAAVAQGRHFGLLAGQLVFAFAGALLLAVSAALASSGHLAAAKGSRGGAAVALLFGVVLPLVGRVARFDAVWWDARAVAESVKTSAWRYLMGAPPFPLVDDGQTDQAFQEQIVAARRARPSIAAALERHRDGHDEEITEIMRTQRGEARANRLAFYLEHRLGDQRRWYSEKARFHDRTREAYFLGTVGVQLVALVAAFFDWRPWGLNAVTLLVALSSSLIAWSQAKRHEELSQAYALARQELDLMELRLRGASSDADFGASVAEAEEAISREHTMWMARRNR
jgi:hypothetical protein